MAWAMGPRDQQWWCQADAEKIEAICELVLAEAGLNRTSFVAGLPDRALGERLVLVVEGDPFSTQLQQELMGKMSARLAKYEAPKAILFVEHFVETVTQKIDRKATIPRAWMVQP